MTPPIKNNEEENENSKNTTIKRAYNFDTKSFNFLKQTAFDYAGLKLQENKEGTLYNRLVKRLRFLQLTDFNAYCEIVKNNPDEKQKYINLIANPLTSFFREKHHFQFLEYNLLPELIRTRKKIRIWSAGCSTGEEPYSISIIINKVITNVEDYDIKILATDINTDSLEIAKKGIYETDKIKNLSHDTKKLYFYHGIGNNQGLVKIHEDVRRLITFSYLNLIDDWPMKNPFDIIFCRNVLIYFPREISNKIIEKCDKSLVNGGHLFLGYTENSLHLPDYYSAVDKTIFKKNVIKIK